MLIQIDRHTEELTKQSETSTKRWDEQHLPNQYMLAGLKEISTTMEGISTNVEEISAKMKDMEKISHQHLEQLVHSATIILDRIIRKDHLKV